MRVTAATIVLAALAVQAGCTSDRPAPASAPGYGAKAGVRIGVRVSGDGLSIAEPGRLTGRAAPENVRADVTAQFNAPCQTQPCLAPGRVRLRLTAVYDLTTPIAVTPAQIDVGLDESVTSVTLPLPDRSRGRHCLILMAAEPAEDPVGASAPQHVLASATVFELGGGTPAHCAVPESDDTTWRTAPQGVSCPFAALSSSESAVTARKYGEHIWAYVPRCSGAAYGLLFHDDALAEPVISVPAGHERAYVPLPKLAPGGWRLVVVQDHGRSLYTSVSEPLIVPR